MTSNGAEAIKKLTLVKANDSSQCIVIVFVDHSFSEDRRWIHHRTVERTLSGRVMREDAEKEAPSRDSNDVPSASEWNVLNQFD